MGRGILHDTVGVAHVVKIAFIQKIRSTVTDFKKIEPIFSRLLIFLVKLGEIGPIDQFSMCNSTLFSIQAFHRSNFQYSRSGLSLPSTT